VQETNAKLRDMAVTRPTLSTYCKEIETS